VKPGDIIRRWSVINALAHYSAVLRNLMSLMQGQRARGYSIQEMQQGVVQTITYELQQRAVPHVASYYSRKVIP